MTNGTIAIDEVLYINQQLSLVTLQWLGPIGSRRGSLRLLCLQLDFASKGDQGVTEH